MLRIALAAVVTFVPACAEEAAPPSGDASKQKSEDGKSPKVEAPPADPKAGANDDTKAPPTGGKLHNSYDPGRRGVGYASAEALARVEVTQGKVEVGEGGPVDVTEAWFGDKKRQEIEICYANAFTGDRNAKGKLVLSVDVEVSGKTTTTASENTTGNDGLADCVLARAKEWALPQKSVEKPFSVSVEFELKPASGK